MSLATTSALSFKSLWVNAPTRGKPQRFWDKIRFGIERASAGAFGASPGASLAWRVGALGRLRPRAKSRNTSARTFFSKMMSQRLSGYQRKEFDRYQTPEWVTNVLMVHIPDIEKREAPQLDAALFCRF
jgi:hypothetical protein